MFCDRCVYVCLSLSLLPPTPLVCLCFCSIVVLHYHLRNEISVHLKYRGLIIQLQTFLFRYCGIQCDIVASHSFAQDEFARVSEQYREVSGGVTERSRKLAQITEELESVKQEMDERGSSMTDGSMSQRVVVALLLLLLIMSLLESSNLKSVTQHIHVWTQKFRNC